MGALLNGLAEIEAAFPPSLTPIEKIRCEIEEALGTLGTQQEMPHGVPTIAFVALLFKALLLERSRFQSEPGDWDITLGERLLKIDPLPETLELIVELFDGTFLLENKVIAISG